MTLTGNPVLDRAGVVAPEKAYGRIVTPEKPTIRPELINIHSDKYNMPLRSGLSESELMEALILRDYSRGTMAVTGPPGTGKSQFDIWIAGKLWRYFYRPVVADFYPTPEFIRKVDGNFTYIDENILLDQIKAVHDLSKRDGSKLTQEEISQWVVDGKGDSGVKLRGCTLLLDEPDRWSDCRRSSSDINMIIGDMFKRWRHFDILIVMSTPDIMDLDRKRVVKRFTSTCECEALVTEPTFEDYYYLCAAQGLEPDPDEFIAWYAEALEEWLEGNYSAMWFRYKLARRRRVSLGTVIDEIGTDTITVFGPNFWKYFWTDNPSSARTSILRKNKL